MVQRMCFQLQVKPERIDDYRASHAAVWPDMLSALRDAGWRNYSLFLRPDGQLIGYFEADDVQAAQAAIADSDVNARWQAGMSELFVDSGSNSSLVNVAEVFNLDDQLAAAGLAVDHHQASPAG